MKSISYPIHSLISLQQAAYQFAPGRWAFAVSELAPLREFQSETFTWSSGLYQLVYITDGTVRVLLPLSEERLLPGDFLFLLPRVKQTWFLTGRLSGYICLLNRRLLVERQPDAFHIIRLNTPYRKLPIRNYPNDFVRYIDWVLDEYNTPRQLKRTEQLILLKCMFINQIMREVGAGTDFIADDEREIIASFLEMIWEEKLELRSVETYADRLRISVPKLNMLLKKHAHKTAGQLLREFLADYAAQMLRTSQRPLIEIADELGFSSDSNFHRFFKRQMGLTPNEFRIKAQSTQNDKHQLKSEK